MALALPEFAPAQSALLLLDLQNGIFGRHREEARAQELLGNAVRLAQAARAAGVQVVHCTKYDRPGFVGWTLNTPSWRARARHGEPPMLRESDAAEVLPELGPDPTDLIVPRTRGASVFTGTELNQTLRNVGAKAIVLVGISLNIAIMTATTEGVSCGYEVIVPEDAVLGFPYDYGEAMLTHSIRVMATLTKTDTLVDRWGSETPGEKVKQW